MKTTERERIFIFSGIIALLLVIFYVSVVDPAMKRSKLLDRLIIKKNEDIKELKKLKNIYIAQNEAIDIINKKLKSNNKKFAILSFLEEMARKVGIKNNIAKMKPFNSIISELYKESSVELKVDGITINQLVDYLYKIENNEKVLNIKKLRLKKKTRNPNILDVTFEVAAFELIE